MYTGVLLLLLLLLLVLMIGRVNKGAAVVLLPIMTHGSHCV